VPKLVDEISFTLCLYPLTISPRPSFYIDETRSMEFDALIIGAGLSGIAAAYHFSKLGMRFKVLEANSGEGGTWFW
jgi:ribulose 1,5-bisphosphate synthetase/thiazole synthase